MAFIIFKLSSFKSSTLYIEVPPIPSRGLIIIFLCESKKALILLMLDEMSVFGINSGKCVANTFSLNFFNAHGLLWITAPLCLAKSSK